MIIWLITAVMVFEYVLVYSVIYLLAGYMEKREKRKT